MPGGCQLEFILAVPGRRYGDFVDPLAALHATQWADAKQEVLGEARWNQLRLIVAHYPQAAAQAGTTRDRVIQTLERQAAQWAGKLDERYSGKSASRHVGASCQMAVRAHASTMRYAKRIWRASCVSISKVSYLLTPLTSELWRMRA